MRTWIPTVLFVFLLVPFALGEDPASDPTEADEAMKRALEEARRREQPGAPGRETPVVVPAVAVRGVMEAEGRPAAALLEVDRSPALLVHAGDRVVLGGAWAEMLVKEIGPAGVRVEFMPGSREVLLR